MHASDLRTRDFERILLIKLSAFGDVIHTIPVLNELRRRYPAARIDWLIKPALAELIRHHPAVSNVIAFPQFERGPLLRSAGRWLAAFWRLARELRAARYDLVVDLHGQFRTALPALMTGAPVRIGFDRPRGDVRLASPRKLPALAYRHGWTGAREGSWLAYTNRLRIASLEVHAVDRYLRMAAMLGCREGPPDFSFAIPEKATERVDMLLAKYGVPGGARPELVLLAPGTVWETKRWTAAGFAEVARHFVARSRTVVLIGSRDEIAICRQVAAEAPGVIDLSGETTITELAALMRRAAIALTNDSGPMHLAVALQRRTISIFGPTDPVWVGPYGRPEEVVQVGLSCSPCYLRDLRRCPHHHACMRDLTAPFVIERMEQVLAAGTASGDAGRVRGVYPRASDGAPGSTGVTSFSH